MLARTSALCSALATSLLVPAASAQSAPQPAAQPGPASTSAPAPTSPAPPPAGAAPPPPSAYGRPAPPGWREVYRDGAWRYEPSPAAYGGAYGSWGAGAASDERQGPTWYGWQILLVDVASWGV